MEIQFILRRKLGLPCSAGGVRYLDWEDPLEEGVATHSSILPWRIPMDRGAWWTTVHGLTDTLPSPHFTSGEERATVTRTHHGGR